MRATKPKIAILGGGMAALTVALRLTEDGRWRDRFESITVYQMGWRLGGKGAAGRGEHDRIEEHGLHVWLGFYENAFSNLQRVYEELKRPAGSPMATREDAFRHQDWIGVADLQGERWHPCLFKLPRRRGTPGDGVPPPSLSACMRAALRWTSANARKVMTDEQDIAILIEIEALRKPGPNVALVDPLKRLVGRIDVKLRAASVAGDDACLLRLVGLAAAVTLGLLADGISSETDLGRLENIDMADWLRNHGAPENIADPQRDAFVRGLYDFAFAYRAGDPDQPAFAAGPALRTLYRMCFTYKGSVFYKLEAGMGDTVFAPIYLVLRKRGVAFDFFNRVDRLVLSADRRRIERIDIAVQATVTAPPYEPLVDVVSSGHALPLPCWPAQPRYDQLGEGDQLQQDEIDLESFWTPWKDAGRRSLNDGREFDIAVLGVSIGSLPFLCDELIRHSTDWQNMVRDVKTVATQAAQLWLKQPYHTKYPLSQEPILDAWIQPLNTWADMSGLLARKRENWPVGAEPKSLDYFCGPLPGYEPDPSNGRLPSLALAEVMSNAQALLSSVQTLWGHPIAPADVQARFLRPNIDPSQRYVLSLPKSASSRLRADGAGFENLALTGDWTLNRYNAGCIEAATWSGMQAANVILGRPIDDGIVYG